MINLSLYDYLHLARALKLEDEALKIKEKTLNKARIN